MRPRAPMVPAQASNIVGKFWIQHDGTEHGIADGLVAAGGPRDHIVLGFRPAYAGLYVGSTFPM